jgi:hypothetical protein
MKDILEKNTSTTEFLDLLCSRLKHRYNENEKILSKLESIKDDYLFLPKKIELDVLDKICKKFYFDFDMEKSLDLKLGYTEEERSRIRIMVFNIAKEFAQCSKI